MISKRCDALLSRVARQVNHTLLLLFVTVFIQLHFVKNHSCFLFCFGLLRFHFSQERLALSSIGSIVKKRRKNNYTQFTQYFFSR